MGLWELTFPGLGIGLGITCPPQGILVQVDRTDVIVGTGEGGVALKGVAS